MKKNILLVIIMLFFNSLSFAHSREIALKIVSSNGQPFQTTLLFYQFLGDIGEPDNDFYLVASGAASGQQFTDPPAELNIGWYNFVIEFDNNYNMTAPYTKLENDKQYMIKVGNSYIMMNTGHYGVSADIEVSIQMNSSNNIGSYTVYNTDAQDRDKRTGFGLTTQLGFSLSDFKPVTVTQQFNAVNSDDIGYSPIEINSVNSIDMNIPSGKSVFLKKNATKYLVGKNNEDDNKYFKSWNLSSQTIINVLPVTANSSDQSAFQDSKSTFTAPMTIDGILQTESTIKIYDPWYIDPANGVQKPTVGREMRNLLQSTAPVFKGIEYINQTLTPYEIQLGQNDASSNPIYYLSNSKVNLSTDGFNSTNKFFVKFDGTPEQPSSLSVNFKGHLRTAQPNNAYTKNQRRFAVNGNNQILVYESMNDIWVTTSNSNDALANPIWSQEKRLNVRQGYAKNPTLSNVLADNKVAISWIETNASGVVELHLQTYNIANSNPFGWSSPSATQNSSNHRIASDFGFSVPASYSMPSLYLESSTVLGLAYRNGNCIEAGRLNISSDLSSAILSGSIKFLGDYSASNPNYVFIPEDGKIFIYYTKSGSTNGYHIYQFDWNANSTVELYLPPVYISTGQYGATGLQAATYNRTVVLAYQVNSAGGSDVLYYTKPVYYSSPQFYIRYVKGEAATITNTSINPGSVSGKLFFRSADYYNSAIYQNWFSATGSSSATSLNSKNATGIWTKESSAISSDFNHYFVTNESLAKIQKLNSSGGVYKTESDGGFMFNVIANRFWISGEDTSQTVLDFSGAEIEIIRENQMGSLILSAKINSVSEDGLIVTQPDSLLTPLSVELVHNGEVVRSYLASEWDVLSQSSIADLQEGDVLNFRIPAGNFLSGYEDMILVNKGNGLNKRLGSELEGSVLKASELQISAYPNPFNPQTTFKITLPTIQFVTFEVYNMLGQKVQTLVNGKLEAGEHNFQFNGSYLATGTYIYRLVAGEKVQSGKIILMK